LKEAIDFKISKEILKRLDDEYKEQQVDATTPKVEIDRIKIMPSQFPLLRKIQAMPLTSKNLFKAPPARNRDLIKEGTTRRLYRNDCYVTQAEGDFGNSFNSQRVRDDNLDASEWERKRSMLKEQKIEKPLINSKIGPTKRRTSNIKIMGKKIEIC